MILLPKCVRVANNQSLGPLIPLNCKVAITLNMRTKPGGMGTLMLLYSFRKCFSAVMRIQNTKCSFVTLLRGLTTMGYDSYR